MSGRPSAYTDEIADAICLRIAEGESLREICKDDGMPDKVTVLRWLQKPQYAEFRTQYARAREEQADKLADEILKIADDSKDDVELVETDAGLVEKVNHEHIQRSRLRVDARKWAASKLAPKKYGDRVLNEHSGPDGGPIPVSHSITPTQVIDDLREIFGAGAMAPEPGDPLQPPAGRDTAVSLPGAHPEGGESAALDRGQAMAGLPGGSV